MKEEIRESIERFEKKKESIIRLIKKYEKTDPEFVKVLKEQLEMLIPPDYIVIGGYNDDEAEKVKGIYEE